MNVIANTLRVAFSASELLRLSAYANAIKSMSSLGLVSVKSGASHVLLEQSFQSIHQLCDQLEPLISQFDDVVKSESMEAVLNGFETVWLLVALVSMSIPSNPSNEILGVAFGRIHSTSALLLDLLAQLELEGVAA